MAELLLSADGTHLWLRSSYAERDAALKLPGVSWKKDDGMWFVPKSLAVCYVARGVFKDRLTVSEEVQLWAKQEQERERPLRELVANPLGVGFPGDRPYQTVGTQFLVQAALIRGGALLTDEQGTGKTKQLIDALVALGEDAMPCLIVCPKTLIKNWKREFALWAPQVRTVAITGGAAARVAAIELLAPARADAPAKIRKGVEITPARIKGQRAADVGMISWQSLAKHTKCASYGAHALSEAEKEPKEFNTIVQPQTIIADEAHRGTTPTAQQTRAWWWVCDQAKYKFAATGTPIRDTPDHLWGLLRAVDKSSFAVRSKFVERYCAAAINPFGGLTITGLRPDTEPELRRTLDVTMLRRTKDQVLPHLPPRIPETRYVELTPRQRKAYNEFRDTLLTELESGAQLIGFSPLQSLTRLVQLASATVVSDDGGATFSLSEPSAKLDALEELIEDLAPEQVIVFAMSRQLIDLAEARLKKAHVTTRKLTGGVSEDDRDRAVNDFQDGNARVFLATLGAGGEGITLTAGRHLVFLQRSWSMLETKQAMDRNHRIGSERHSSVVVWDLIAEDTVEENVLTRLEEKGERFEEVVRDRQRLAAALRNGL